MKRSSVLDLGLLLRLTERPEFENIVVGTGALARDMQRKLRLLGLKVPFLVGEAAHPGDDGILAYTEIAALGDAKRYRFIMCCDLDEWTLIARANASISRFLGSAGYNHSQFIQFNALDIIYEVAGGLSTDAGTNGSCLYSGLPYMTWGDVNDKQAFHIHLVGTCHTGSILHYAGEAFPMLLHKTLSNAGLKNVITAWGQPQNSTSDDIFRFIRDICFYRINLLLVTLTVNELEQTRFGVKNSLPVRTGAFASSLFIQNLKNTYKGITNEGTNHNIALQRIKEIQSKVFAIYSQIYRFNLMYAVVPDPSLLKRGQGQALQNISEGYMTRRKEKKEKLILSCGECIVKDHTDIFDDTKDIFSAFPDGSHFSDYGNRLWAKRCATDILAEYGAESTGRVCIWKL